MRRFTNDYNSDGKKKRQEARELAGHRCLRCGHPYETGKHGKGEWSPCDHGCVHSGEVAVTIEGIRKEFNASHTVKFMLSPSYRGGRVQHVEARWRILTVHHFDGDKKNDAWWNLLSLCQRCHLEIQTKVDPHQPWMFEHSDWLKPYVAAFYAFKYEQKMITREEADRRLEELLNYERRDRPKTHEIHELKQMAKEGKL